MANEPAETTDESKTRPYVVLRKDDDGRWSEVGVHDAPRSKVAAELAHAATFEPPAETTTVHYRAFPSGNDARHSVTVEVKPVLTWG